ncbi:hypothetical protein L3X38_003912 [Prunus dulcis]|uniref:Uncharacterized protein n=1 Tax=Prunus dulcis TaxID=3755 RepID=A0AAD4ZN10_PRUDU|nr:hypothetical protein L3X38_003912 [Prunus dulcis]
MAHLASILWEAFWELTGFGFVGTPKLSELEAGAIPGWVTTLGSCFVSSQKQNRAGWNSKVKRVGGWNNPRMGDHPGKLLCELPETKPCGLFRIPVFREYNDVIGDYVLGDIRIECEPFTRGIPNVDTFDDLVGEIGSENIRDGCEEWID